MNTYELNELTRATREQQLVRKSPLLERKEAQAELKKCFVEYPEMIGERIGWLFYGNYGKGEQMQAEEILKRTRSNRVAQLCQLIAIEEWDCPEPMTVSAWKSLIPEQRKRLDTIIQEAITEQENKVE